jgi:hypothetical protein
MIVTLGALGAAEPPATFWLWDALLLQPVRASTAAAVSAAAVVSRLFTE